MPTTLYIHYLNAQGELTVTVQRIDVDVDVDVDVELSSW